MRSEWWVPMKRSLCCSNSWNERVGSVEGKTDEIRIGAANALAMIGTPEAKAILEVGKDSKDESIRDACMQALKSQST